MTENHAGRKFPTVDADRLPETAIHNGEIVLQTDREVLQEFGYIEPTDDRDGDFYTVPMRSVHGSLTGVVFEFGPYALDEADTVHLLNALHAHVDMFPDTFRTERQPR